MQSKVMLRNVPATGANFVGLGHAASHNLQLRSYCQLVALGPGKFKADPVTACDALVVQQHRRAIQVFDNDVDVPVVVEISSTNTAAHPDFLQGWARLLGGVTEVTVRQVH